MYLLDDADGTVWVMKTHRAAYGQTHGSQSTLGERHNSLPARCQTRVEVLDKDLILAPAYEELARMAQNPPAHLIGTTMRNCTHFDVGWLTSLGGHAFGALADRTDLVALTRINSA